MRLVDQWAAVEETLPAAWQDVRLTLTTEQPGELARAAQVLGPMSVGRVGDALSFRVRRAGGGSGPEAARRLFARLDADRVWCLLQAGEIRAAEATGTAAVEASGAASQWDVALANLPADWSDLLCEIDVAASDLLPRVALLCAPVNPARDPDGTRFTFRCARRSGFGVSPAMARRCFERLDEERIGVGIGIRGALADTRNADTQGPMTVTGVRATPRP